MSTELKDMVGAPTLVFDPMPQTKEEVVPVKEEPKLDDNILTEEEKKQFGMDFEEWKKAEYKEMR